MKNEMEFRSELKKKLQDLIDKEGLGYILSETDVVKYNDRVLLGICCKASEEDAFGATLYVDDMIDEYSEHVRRGLTKDQALEKIAEIMSDVFKNSLSGCGAIKMPKADIPRWDQAKDRIVLRLAEEERNLRFLSDKPCKYVGAGLVLYAVFQFSDELKASVTDDMLETMGVDKYTLFDYALINAEKNDPPLMADMTSMLFGMPDNMLDGSRTKEAEEAMYIVTSEKGGAASFFYPGIKEKAEEIFGGGYLILPSSIHEVIILPEKTAPDTASLSELVGNANNYVVSRENLLSDSVFHYSKKSGFRRV